MKRHLRQRQASLRQSIDWFAGRAPIVRRQLSWVIAGLIWLMGIAVLVGSIPIFLTVVGMGIYGGKHLRWCSRRAAGLAIEYNRNQAARDNLSRMVQLTLQVFTGLLLRHMSSYRCTVRVRASRSSRRSLARIPTHTLTPRLLPIPPSFVPISAR